MPVSYVPDDPQLTDIETDLSTLSDDIEALDSAVEVADDEIEVVDGEIEVIDDELAALTTAVGVVDDELAALTTATGVIDDELAALATAVGVIDGEIEALATAVDGVADELEVVETHLHAREYWFGKSGATNLFLENALTPWRVTAGDSGAFGEWVQLAAGTEVAAVTGGALYDLHRIFVTTASASNNLYYIQLGTGAGGAQVVRTTVPQRPAASLRQAPVNVMMPRIAANVLLWARCACATNGGTMDFVVGLHVYTE